MVNNPFRGKPISKVDQKVAEWGKTKFKPNKFGSGKGNNSYNRKFDNRKGNFNKNKNNDSYKFNQVAKDAKPENATPWNKYKDEIVFKQREEEQAALQANMDSEEAKQVLKQREINYRKLLIEQKKQEPTQWESFVDEDGAGTAKKKDKKQHKSFDVAKLSAKNKKSESINKNNKTIDKTISHKEGKHEVKQLIPQEVLDNFDSKKLSFKQNDKMRRIITKTAALAYGNSLKNTIKDLKRKKIKKYN